MYISHIKQDNGEWLIQSNDEHCANVSHLAQGFAAECGLPTFGKVIGLLHDKGKERTSFQNHIKKVSGYDDGAKCDEDYYHAFVGGIIAHNNYGEAFNNLLTNQIISHHSGMHDYMNISDAVSKAIPEGVTNNPILPGPGELVKELSRLNTANDSSCFHHISRILFSCLVDADFIDTEHFMCANKSELRGGGKTLTQLLPLLDDYLYKLKIASPASHINNIRGMVQQRCIEASASSPGFYSLTVPTGGGKTLSSMLWAIKHAIRNEQRRVIIAIPYTSIIVQTAEILKRIFGEENVLEHHSDFDPNTITDEVVKEKAKLATENWDYPIIVTTNVQLFESMYGYKPAECRKLHNIANSVIILDEAQTLPADFLNPIVNALKAYQRLFNVSVLFTTASQPVLTGTIRGCNSTVKFEGLDNVTEIIPESLKLHKQLQRVNLVIDNTPQSYDEVACKLAEHPQVLCIVNTRRDAYELFTRLPAEGYNLHLSRNMCPAHIKSTLASVKELLADSNPQPIRLISTQLIEAGVDIDFPVVFRQESGLDSILQAAGRCNREGKQAIANTFVFSLAKEHQLSPKSIVPANEARKNLPADSDWFSPHTIAEYFEQLYCRCSSFDKNDIKHYLYDFKQLCFESAASQFKLIADEGKPVIVNWMNSCDLVETLRRDGISYKLMKELSKFTINVHTNDFKKLCECCCIEQPIEGIYFIPDQRFYNEYTGLCISNPWVADNLII